MQTAITESLLRPIYPPAGTVLRYWVDGYWHYGLLVQGNQVIHNSKFHGKVVKQALHEFANGNEPEIVFDLSSENLLQACDRAHEFLGMPYALFTQNCEHFVRLAHGLMPESPQIQQALIVAGSGTVALSSKNRAVQFTSAGSGTAALIFKDSPLKAALWGGLAGFAAHLLTA